jgi:hypothetical protein
LSISGEGRALDAFEPEIGIAALELLERLNCMLTIPSTKPAAVSQWSTRAGDDTARMDIMSKDPTLSDASLRRVFDNVKAAAKVDASAAYDRGKFVDEFFFKDS